MEPCGGGGATAAKGLSRARRGAELGDVPGSAACCRNAADGRKDKHGKMDWVFWFSLITEFTELHISPPGIFWELLCWVTAPSLRFQTGMRMRTLLHAMCKLGAPSWLSQPCRRHWLRRPGWRSQYVEEPSASSC